jgi:hypothetical protein
MATAHGSNFKLYVKEQTNAETLATGDFVQLPVLSFGLTGSQALGSDDLLSAGIGRDGSDPYLETLTVGGEASVPIDTVNFGYWLKMLLGPATVTGTTDKVHVFTSGKTTLPDFTMEKAFPEVPSYDKYLGVKCGSMSFDIAPTGPANATVGLMGLGETTTTTSGAGTPTLEAPQRFYRPSSYIKKDGATLGKVTGGRANLSNNMSGVQTVRADNRIEEVDYGNFTADGDLRVRFTTNDLKTQAMAGTPCALEYGFQISPTKALKFEFPRVFLSRPGVQVSGPAGIELPISWRAAFDPTVGSMVRVTLSNQKASY